MLKVIIDSNLSQDLFLFEGFIQKPEKSIMIVTNLETGKSDTTVRIFKDSFITHNANIYDPDRKTALQFGDCKSYCAGDTVVIQFWDRHSFHNDGIFVYIVNGYFSCEYKSVDSEYWLSVIGQELTLTKSVTKKGEKAKGQLVVIFSNRNPKSNVKHLTLTGGFDCVIQ